MGGSPAPPPAPPGQAPIPVPPMPMWGQPNPFQQLTPPQSVKGGTMQGLPSLQDVFNLPQGANPLFPNSQSFPQAPFVRPGTMPPAGGGGVVPPNPDETPPPIVPPPMPPPVIPPPDPIERDH